ncbi:MAG: hypothetical protein BHV99_05880 [Clostridium sp. 26_21]|nr:MAG: hypothetical protein BHV99_05880 [Clostridium sp. 26_21]
MVMENMLAYAEIDEILNLLENDYREKVPKKVRDFFKEEKMKDYHPEIDIEKPLIEQNLKRETMVLLAILNLNYWCENEEEKQSFLDELDKNEEEKKELEEKYNPDNLFKKEKQIKILKEENTSLIEYKKTNMLKRVFERIINFFKRK